jgi:hypothetical protein
MACVRSSQRRRHHPILSSILEDPLDWTLQTLRNEDGVRALTAALFRRVAGLSGKTEFGRNVF